MLSNALLFLRDARSGLSVLRDLAGHLCLGSFDLRVIGSHSLLLCCFNRALFAFRDHCGTGQILNLLRSRFRPLFCDLSFMLGLFLNNIRPLDFLDLDARNSLL